MRPSVTASPARPHFTASSPSERLPGESRLVDLIREWLGAASPPSPRGMGDDCAVLPPGTPGEFRLATTDCVLRGRHFDDAVAPRHVGRKLVNRNLSDIAAMGGTPADALLSLVCGPDVALPWLSEFFKGVAEACLAAGLELSGGDCAEGGPGFFCATLALTGFARRPLLRAGARAGDTLLVTGRLGGSLSSGRHHSFAPRLAEGRWLAGRDAVRAAMDVSDGLAKDLQALLPKDCDALLFPEKIPISGEIAGAGPECVPENAPPRPGSPLFRALCDGEDYELLLAADTARLPRLLSDWRREFPGVPLSPIGLIVPAAPLAPCGRRLLLAAPGASPPVPFQPSGYQHFSGEGA
ncbi:MAG: thiamine-phosphate kinase [Puniceicoccales bacterium]|jgi:thiamine-monophosphate kinase|nr:thiamine-phosphate kinase [Puniceicoccales bacterium]